MAEFALVDYFIMGEAIGIVATLVVSFYYSRKQMQKLSVDIESKVLSDMDENISTKKGIQILSLNGYFFGLFFKMNLQSKLGRNEYY